MHDLANNIDNFPQGHPVRVYIEENFLIKNLFKELFKTDVNEDFQAFYNIFNQLCEVEKHFARKENQLFPYLEKYGWTNPSQGMWAFHDQIREELLEEQRIAKEKQRIAKEVSLRKQKQKAVEQEIQILEQQELFNKGMSD